MNQNKTKISILTSLYNCGNYIELFLQHALQCRNLHEIEILLLHNAPQKKEIEIIENYLPMSNSLRHIIIPEREGLYETWNRGIKLAKGEYIGVWNVDDIRTSDSIALQADTLDKHPQVALTYGDCIISTSFGALQGANWIEPEFSTENKEFFRTHFIGCFPMWRKQIHEDCGYFDEQFKLVADLDFQIRVARRFSLKKTAGTMGYFLDKVQTKLSSNRKLQKRENNVLMKRYGVFDLIDYVHVWLNSEKKINPAVIKNFSVCYPIETCFPEYKRFISERMRLKRKAWLRQPRYAVAYIKHFVFNLGY